MRFIGLCDMPDNETAWMNYKKRALTERQQEVYKIDIFRFGTI